MAQVLIIDDDMSVTHLLQEHLTQEGYQVLVAHDAQEGFSLAAQNRPELILLDVVLPDATGFQVCSKLRNNATTRAIPVILMTGTAKLSDHKKFGRSMGANEYISKPFQIIEIDEMINKYMGPKTGGKHAEGGAQRVDDLSELTSILEQTLQPKEKEDPRKKDIVDEGVKTPEASESKKGSSLLRSFTDFLKDPEFGAFSEVIKPTPLSEEPKEAEPAPATPPAPTPIQPEIHPPAASEDDERYFNFSAEVFALASKLEGTRADIFLADHLLRCGTAVGARISESQSTQPTKTTVAALEIALKEIRETGYWLLLARKAGHLAAHDKLELEQTCHDLTTQLAERLTTTIQEVSSH